jgi:hypothetical protein
MPPIDPLQDPHKDASNRLNLGTAFLYSADICMHYRQLGCAKRVVNYRMSNLLKPAFAAQIHSAQSWEPHSHMLRVFHTRGLSAHTMWLVALTIGLTTLLEDGLVLEFLVMCSTSFGIKLFIWITCNAFMVSHTLTRNELWMQWARSLGDSKVGFGFNVWY